MALTTFTQELFDGFYDDDVNKALFHGHTFTANPTGCAAALASLDLLLSEDIRDGIARIHKQHLSFQERIENHPRVKTTRVLGVIFALEFKRDSSDDYYGDFRNTLYRFFIGKGIILRPVGNIVYVLPPYIISEQELEKVYQIIGEALDKF